MFYLTIQIGMVIKTNTVIFNYHYLHILRVNVYIVDMH